MNGDEALTSSGHRALRGRRGGALALAVLPIAALACSLPVRADDPCAPGQAPDLLVGDMFDVVRYGAVSGVTGYALGATACNLGTCRANWVGSSAQHPVIGQNLFRLKSGRFEQIGQGWVKHAFTAESGSLCSAGCVPSDSSHLGVSCSDMYVASLNGTQTRIGPKFEVNAATGVFPYPATGMSTTGDAIFKRLQVHDTDLDPALNTGALYYGEVQYVAQDDAAAGLGANNASYKRMLVSVGAGPVYNLAFTGSVVRQKAAVRAWKASDPAVVESTVAIPGDGTMILAAKAVSLGGGIYRYEYALQNLSSDRSAGGFHIPLPAGAVVSNVGFHDVDYHSGAPYNGTDWPGLAGAEDVSWATVPYAVNPNANALRWGTLYNFRFDANVVPGTTTATIDLFKPGAGSSVQASTVGPFTCLVDGVCATGETCGNCPSDCANQGGGSGCCGNAACETGENPCRCGADCGTPSAVEAGCANAIDDDCDGSTDCADADCCTSGACAAFDADGDQFGALCDCDDADALVHATPGEVRELLLSPGGSGGVAMTWSPPLDPGGDALRYDALRSSVAGDFTAPAACVAAGTTDTTAIDYDLVVPGTRFYLVRAVNECPAGQGPLGTSSNGQPTQGRSCP